MALSSQMAPPEDVALVRYTVDRVSCGGESFDALHQEIEVPLFGFTVIGGTPGFDWSPIAEGSEHFFADLLLPVPSGCYDITAQPITETGEPSLECSSASLNGVFIEQGKISEVVLISQCKNNETTQAADIPTLFNTPPAVTGFPYDPNKHVPRCYEQTICATAKDPDNDPIEFEWALSAGDPVASGPTLVSTTVNADGSVTECQKITPGTAGGRTLTVNVYDMMLDSGGPGLIRFEDYFTSIGDPKDSHGTFELPSYAHEAPEICNPIACDELPPPTMPVVADQSCTFTPPPPGPFNVAAKWQKSSFTTAPTYNQVMMTPVVGNLTDDNGDGNIDENDIPDIVFTTFAANAYTSAGYLRAISGKDGTELWSVSGVAGTGGVALGDTDANGVPEVYSVDTSGNLKAFSNMGAALWTCNGVGGVYPAIADRDGDGKGEILLGRRICSHTGQILQTTILGHGHIPFFADLDQDGQMEVVSGAGISNFDGTTRWTINGSSAAIGNFDGDPQPELAIVGAGWVRLYNHDGTLIWHAGLPGGGGGPPTIADFDGDGQAEIGVAGRSQYVVFETNGTVKWQRAIQDYSSQATGSSVYDFNGDGASEVVFADEQNLWVFDGKTGNILLQETGHSSGTLYEYPVIADVDRDGHVEIVLASNNYYLPGWTGITVLGDPSNRWVTGRPVWNQHAYHITNVNDDLSIPTHQVANWIGGNNTFRAGAFSAAGPLAAGDLVPVLIESCPEACPTSLRVLFQIENRGANIVGVGLPWAVYGVDANGTRTMLISGALADALQPGSSTPTQEVILPNSTSYASLVLVADDNGNGAGVQPECDEQNNEVTVANLCP